MYLCKFFSLYTLLITMKIQFTKMHGAGNDYIYVDATRYHIPDPAAASIAWSHRHYGIGGDGLVLIGRPDPALADFSMRLFNADGSEAAMCGNASRCIGKLVYEMGLTRERHLRLSTPSGVKLLELEVDEHDLVTSVTVDMLAPIFDDKQQFLPTGEPLPDGCFVSMGNPLYVIFVNDLNTVDVATLGARLEYHSRFPQRCNIVFAQPASDGLRVRVWERGSGITLACGTGACAAVAAAAQTGLASRHCDVIMDGGTLHVDWRESDDHLLLGGPSTIVYTGEIDLL